MERRKEKRHTVPELYREYVTFKIKYGSEFIDADLLDFSPFGIKIRVPSAIAADTTIDCFIGIPRSLTREVPFRTKVKYCIPDGRGGKYLVGTEIIETGNRIWLDLFLKIHDFIKERIGEIF